MTQTPETIKAATLETLAKHRATILAKATTALAAGKCTQTQIDAGLAQIDGLAAKVAALDKPAAWWLDNRAVQTVDMRNGATVFGADLSPAALQQIAKS